MANVIRIGTRGSALARWQANWVHQQLTALGTQAELVIIETTGDVTSGSIAEIGGQGVFTKEIQAALLDGRIDLAVHSLKDLPTETVSGLTLAAVPRRESNRDLLICREEGGLDDLPSGGKVGTGSARRRAHLLHYRGDLDVQDIRGNVDTRLRKLDEGQFDAIVLAEAGMNRLGLLDAEQRHVQRLPLDILLPAVGQGALGLEARDDDESTAAALAPLNDRETQAAVTVERALLAALRAGCLAPVGAWGRMEDGVLRLDATVLAPDGSKKISAAGEAELSAAADLGESVAAKLSDQGAADLIDAAHQ